jgi:hypothetical protein
MVGDRKRIIRIWIHLWTMFVLLPAGQNISPQRKGKAMAHLSVQEFIETWEKSLSVTEVAQKTSLTKPTVQAKATQLRKLGIPLKKFKGARHRIDVDAALKQLAKIRGTSVASLVKESKEAEKKRSQRDRR